MIVVTAFPTASALKMVRMEVIFAQLNYLANKIKLVPCS
jgi:hypothetical protein